MRPFLRFFLSSPDDAAGLEVFFAALVASVVLAGALEAVAAGAFPAVDAGLGAIMENAYGSTRFEGADGPLARSWWWKRSKDFWAQSRRAAAP